MTLLQQLVSRNHRLPQTIQSSAQSIAGEVCGVAGLSDLFQKRDQQPQPPRQIQALLLLRLPVPAIGPGLLDHSDQVLDAAAATSETVHITARRARRAGDRALPRSSLHDHHAPLHLPTPGGLFPQKGPKLARSVREDEQFFPLEKGNAREQLRPRGRYSYSCTTMAEWDIVKGGLFT